MNAVYPETVSAVMAGDIDFLSDSIRVLMVDATYIYSAAHDFLNDVGGGSRVGTAVALTGKSVDLGVLFADPVTFTAVTGDTVTGLIIYRHTGVESTSELIDFIDRKADSTPFAIVPNGGNITLTWPSGRVVKI